MIAALIFGLLFAPQGPPPGGMRHGPGPGGPPSRPADSGKWWNNRELVERLGLSGAQQKQIEQIFQRSRIQLIDLRAALEKQESLLDPLLADDHPQEGEVLPQIDRVAAARADLERANARMLFEIRLVLTPAQWKDLQSGQSRGIPPPGRAR